MRTGLKERDVETLIDNELKNLGWNDTPTDVRNCNVYKQRVKTEEQATALQGKRPDYVLYQNNCNTPLAVIEAKKPHQDIHKAQEQAIEYAHRINAPIVYATDGIFTKTHHIKKNKPLYLNNEEVDELLKQSILIHYLQDNIYSTQDKKVIESRDALISIFKKINEWLRDAGIRSGLDRINLLSNMLFLKIISELHEIKDDIVNLPPEDYLWNNFKNKKGLDLLDFLNKQAFDHFKQNYGGEVLSKIEVMSGKEPILNKIIDELNDLWLSDTNTDIKGDAFEFFLRNYGGAETDFGEYFTPRHIVKTLVKLLNPRYGDKVYDPFCGTGGMLIESFKHIKRKMPQNKKNIQTLKEHTVYGGEITTVDRIAKMNMILAGDGHSNITRRDSYEHPQTNKYDVVITNMPFGSRMKTDYLGNYGFKGKSAEIAGVLHCLDAMNDENEKARAGILIPEGILFNGNKGYTALREKLIEHHDIENIVSLPQGVFTDAGVKSNILIVKKKKNKQKKHIWYFNVKSDGYSLDKARRPVEQNDFDTLKAERTLSLEELERLKKVGFQIMYKEDVRNNKYILLPNRYGEEITNDKYEMITVGELFETGRGRVISKEYIQNNHGEYPVYSSQTTNNGVLGYIDTFDFNGEYITWTTDGANAGKVFYRNGKFNCTNVCGTLASKDILRVNLKYATYILDFVAKGYVSIAAGNPKLMNDVFQTIKIPLPPLEEQEQIVAEIESHQKVIDGARQVVESYKSQITIKEKWDNVKLGYIIDIRCGDRITKRKDTGTMYPVYGGGGESFKTDDFNRENELVISRFAMSDECVRYVKGKFWLLDSGFTILVNEKYKTNVDIQYIYRILFTMQDAIYKCSRGVAQKNIDFDLFNKNKIPLPPLEEQKTIVQELEKATSIIEGNKELIRMMEEKIKNKINSLYESI